MESILVLMPSWNAPSELFMLRQLRFLEEEKMLDGIIVIDAGEVRKWRNIPIHSLVDSHLFRRLIRAVVNRTALGCMQPRSKVRMLQAYLNASKADTLFCQYDWFAVQMMPALLNCRKRLIIHCHGHNPFVLKDIPDFKEKLRILSEQALLICNSKETNQRLRGMGISENRMVLKYCAVDVPANPRIRDSTNEMNILHLGRLVDCKSPDRTIQAFELACEKGLKGNLIVAGDGPLRITCELLRARSKWRDRMDITGTVSAERGKELFEKADIFTIHSIKGELTGQVESYGVAVVEAMAATLPVVGCRIGGLIETVVHKQTGYLNEPGDIKAQAAAMIRLARNRELRHKMGIAGWKRAKTHFNIEKEKLSMIQILRNP